MFLKVALLVGVVVAVATAAVEPFHVDRETGEWRGLAEHVFAPARHLNRSLDSITIASVLKADPTIQVVVVVELTTWCHACKECAGLVGSRGRATFELEPELVGSGPISERYPSVLFLFLLGQTRRVDVDLEQEPEERRAPALKRLSEYYGFDTVSNALVAGDWEMKFSRPFSENVLPCVKFFEARLPPSKPLRQIYAMRGCQAYHLEAALYALRRRVSDDEARALIDERFMTQKEKDLAAATALTTKMLGVGFSVPDAVKGSGVMKSLEEYDEEERAKEDKMARAERAAARPVSEKSLAKRREQRRRERLAANREKQRQYALSDGEL